MIKGEHGQEIKAQIHALEEELPPPQRYGAPRNQQLFDRSPKHPRPASSISQVRTFAVFGDENGPCGYRRVIR